MKGRGGCSSIPSRMEVETEGRGSEGKGRRVEDDDEEEGRSVQGMAPAAKSRRIDGQDDDEERMNNNMLEDEDGYRDSRRVELVFGEEEEELDPVQMEEKLRQVKLEMKGKYSYTDELDEEEQMRRYHTSWDSSLSPHYGPFQRTIDEHSGPLPAMCYTHGPIARYAHCDRTLQIFSIQVVRIKKGLEWPLHVYGLVAVRDSVDHNRNLLFHRTRDDCQILTQKDSFLELTGPSRAILIVDPVGFEVELKVKGGRESDDQILSFQLFGQNGAFNGRQSVTLVRRFHPIMLGWYSKFKFTYAVLNGAVEATICRVKVVRGSWTKEYQGRIVCTTSSICHEDFMLLDSQDAETMPIGSDDVIKLSRRVVTVELSGELTVSLTATHVGKRTRDDDGGIAQNDEALFTTDKVRFRPQKSGESCATCKLGFCEVEITVAWSLLNCDNIE
ncbi:hypothetical protein OsI_18026 [Oryza sativa Indica Group]|uniref:DUF6598 domain-containing protein n=1 Tax=Oryza sativa subsp. indica TaxID=39946 RepID=B8ARV0_ORYSI|nr:hypothetical protein OsI_18026 [Oryza sativa Indica Group]